ncbi:hypothetical protein H6P81_010426 [Aristolochia fimbriata]|uniref:RING-type E3 ubiquitin transferase n=1 Tax=Aristolochia fimbriata TaxID=158543 RepID=A0AAV7ERL3_ARIFI|nr:hypothetical protein H6P81_010426 [Aristolochia fimbriata]
MASQSQHKSKSAKSRPFLRLKYSPPIAPAHLNSSPASIPSASSTCPSSSEPSRHQSALSSLFSATSAHNPPAAAAAAAATATSASASSSSKKMHFKSATFRGLGCASAAEVSAPENLVRSSADWQAKRVRKKKQRNARKKKQSTGNNNMVLLPDVWCAPGIGFATDATSVDCVVARRNPNASGTGRGRVDGDRNLGERSCITRRNIHSLEQIYAQDTPSTTEVNRPESDLLPNGHYRHFRGYHRSPGGLAEIMMFQTSFLSGTPDHFDQYRELRLDVDSMSYEELLELGDRIGYVSTGLREEEILRCLRKMKHSILSSTSSHKTAGIDWKCSICQEEYEANDEVGKLECGHSYHLYCIKQWLLQKNACPVCKAVAAH